MKRIVTSLLVIVALVVAVAGATFAVFSSTSQFENNTYATGTLEVRINGQAATQGFNFTNAAPGDEVEGSFDVQNFGAPFFVGPSTLPAKELVISSDGDGSTLFDALMVTIEANRGWATRMPVYTGLLKDLDEGDLLAGDGTDARWTSLDAGNSETVYFKVWLPISADNSVQGQTTTFDFVVDAYNPVRP